MTPLAVLAALSAAMGGLVPLLCGLLFWRDPESGMRATRHRPEQLPRVMVGRYFAFAALAFGAALHGDLRVMLYLFVAFGAVSLADAAIYWRAGHSGLPHLVAAGGCLLV